MRTPRRRLAVGLLLAPLAPLLCGCFVSPPDDSASSGSGGSAASGGHARLRVALAFPPAQNYSPYGQDALILSRLGVTEGLTRLDANGSAIPALASSWSSERGGRSWQFTLREAKFHDGGDVTAEAVAAALTHAAEAEPAPAALAGVRLTAEAVGERQVRVRTAGADPVLPLRLTNPSLAVFSPKAYGKPKAHARSGKPEAYGKQVAVTPVGTATGPFTLTRVTGDTSATLNRFTDYWGGQAQSPGIDARFTPDGTARANALRTGEVDIAEAVPVAQVPSLDRDLVHRNSTARNTGLYLNTRSGAFADPGLRAAAREAVDASAVAKGVYEGYAEPARRIYGPALTWAAGRRIEPTGRAKAAEPHGRSVTLATYNDRPELVETAQVLQQQLERAGFRVRLEVRAYARLESDLLAGKFDAAVASRNVMLDTGDPVALLAGDFGCEGSYSLSLLCDREVDRLVDAARAEADPAGRQEAATAAEAAVLGRDAVVPLVHLEVVTGVAESVRGIQLDPYERELVGVGTRR